MNDIVIGDGAVKKANAVINQDVPQKSMVYEIFARNIRESIDETDVCAQISEDHVV